MGEGGVAEGRSECLCDANEGEREQGIPAWDAKGARGEEDVQGSTEEGEEGL